MSSPQPPDRYRNNKRQRSLNTSNQIPGTMLPSGSMINKRLRSQVPSDDENDSVANAPGGLVAGPAELCQQLDELGLSVFSQVISEVMDVVSSVERNQDHEAKTEEICDLCDQVAIRVIETFKEGKAMSMIKNTVETMTRNLQSTVTEYQRKCAEARCHPDLEEGIRTNFLESVTHSLEQSVEIMRHNGTEERDGMKETILSMSRDTGDTLEVVQRIHAETINIQQTMSSGRDESMSSKANEAALNAIHPRVDSARYDSGSQTLSSFCLEETRVALLKEIEQWAEDLNSRPIIWLCGMAGTGKSTIARTVAKRFDERNYLGASFFFSRDEDDRRTTSLVFPTLAYQLARRKPSLRESIIAAASPDVCTAMMRTQLNKLIVEPLQNASAHPSPLVIVMDALDECVKETQITEMLILLAPAIRLIRETVNLKVFLTSRPEIHISSEFKDPGMEVVSNVSILHDIEKSLVRADIGRYIEYHLHRIAKRILPSHTVWPTPGEVEALADMADGLFIFAAVTIAYIGDSKHRKPKQRLQNILATAEQQRAPVSLQHLDLLYRQIFIASLPEDEDEDHQDIVHQICEILGTVVLLLYPLSSRSLESLLGWDEDTVEPALGPFNSVLSILPDPAPIRVFHKSFPDFLTDKQRSGEFWFHIQSAEHHARLALLCLTHMNSALRRDMCGVGNQLASEIGDVGTMLQAKVKEHVLYACRHWARHLKETTWTEKVEAALRNFCKHKLLYWLEILCLDGKLRSAVLALDSAIKWIRDEAIFVILTDCYRYLVYHYNTISLGPSHIYRSTLPFVPRHNLSNSPWMRELHASPRVIMTDGSDRWDRVLFTLTSHAGDVNAVAYSPDGGTIATGGDDSRVIIWDSRTGAQIHILEGHSARVWAVDFSPNGSLIASGSEDGSVRLWNSATGILLHTLIRHSDAVRAVCFSPLGHMIASGSYDKTIILWDSGTGSFIRMLSGHSNAVLSITLSPDGAQIISSSSDSSIIIWDTETGTVISLLQENQSGLKVYSLAFSPDGTQLASTSRQDVILWNYESHSILRKLEGSTGDVYCVAFSPDGRFAVAGCGTGQVVTWDITTGCQIGRFSGHTDEVVSVAVSPHGSRVITGSCDDTAAVWDMNSGWGSHGGNDPPNQKPHTGAVRCVAISPDGTMLASGAEDDNVALWDIGRHSLIHILKGHKDAVTTVVFSPDGTILASGAKDQDVALWDIRRHSLIHILNRHRSMVTSVAFSPDGRHVASGSLDKSIIIWDPESGESIKTLKLRREVRCLGFSPDGRYLVAACDRSRSEVGPTMLKMWTIEDSRPCQSSSPTVEEAKEVLSGSHGSGSPPSGTYLARDKKSQWIEKRCQRNTVERLCHLTQHVTASASFGRTFVFGTSGGTLYLLDFPPETFGITAPARYTSHDLFDFDFDSNPDPYPDSD